MSVAKGRYLGGVRDAASLLDRCRVDEETGCWRYGGCCINGRPNIQISLPDGRKIRRRGRRVAAIIKLGREPRPDEIAYPTLKCVSADCVRPDHCQLGTLAEARIAAAARGAYDTPAHREHLYRLQQQKRKISVEQEVAIMTSGRPTREEAARHGISLTRVKDIRRHGRARVLPTSVFEWRP